LVIRRLFSEIGSICSIENFTKAFCVANVS
jgi:hypothetical protein